MDSAYRERRKSQNRERRAWYKEHGICIDCGRVFSDPGRVRCHMCMKRQRASRLTSDPDGSKNMTRKKELREERKAAGLCIDCGKPNDGVHARCATCLKKRRESQMILYIRKKIKAENERRTRL